MVTYVKDIIVAADTGNQGDLVHKRIVEELSKSSSITISFDEMDTATSSFVNAALVPLLDTMSQETIKQRIKITDANRQIIAMIRRCMTPPKPQAPLDILEIRC